MRRNVGAVETIVGFRASHPRTMSGACINQTSRISLSNIFLFKLSIPFVLLVLSGIVPCGERGARDEPSLRGSHRGRRTTCSARILYQLASLLTSQACGVRVYISPPFRSLACRICFFSSQSFIEVGSLTIDHCLTHTNY